MQRLQQYTLYQETVSEHANPYLKSGTVSFIKSMPKMHPNWGPKSLIILHIITQVGLTLLSMEETRSNQLLQDTPILVHFYYIAPSVKCLHKFRCFTTDQKNVIPFNQVQYRSIAVIIFQNSPITQPTCSSKSI